MIVEGTSTGRVGQKSRKNNNLGCNIKNQKTKVFGPILVFSKNQEKPKSKKPTFASLALWSSFGIFLPIENTTTQRSISTKLFIYFTKTLWYIT